MTVIHSLNNRLFLFRRAAYFPNAASFKTALSMAKSAMVRKKRGETVSVFLSSRGVTKIFWKNTPSGKPGGRERHWKKGGKKA
jgi:sulfur relay (sulfurtransferase) complex TusBCD TusD component (DsrE family)